MLTIGEFSKLSRVSAKTLRYYDQIGLLKPEFVGRDSGYRYYGVGQLRDMLLIARLKQYQFSLPEIAAVLARKDEPSLSALIREKMELLQRQISDRRHILLQMEQDILKIERRESIMQSNYIVQCVSFEPKNIYSMRRKMGLQDFGQAFGDLFAGLEQQRLKPTGPCLSVYHDEDFDPTCSDIEFGIVVAAPTGGRVRALDPGLCCYTTHIGPYTDFTPCYTVLGEWMEREGYAVSGPPIELYVKGCEDRIPPEEYVTEIYMPIQKRP